MQHEDGAETKQPLNWTLPEKGEFIDSIEPGWYINSTLEWRWQWSWYQYVRLS